MEATGIRTEQPPTREPESLFWRVFFSVGPDLLVSGVFAVVLLGLVLVFHGRFNFNSAMIGYPAAMMLLLISIAMAGQVRRALTGAKADWRAATIRSRALLRDWSPMVILAFIYENLHDLTDAIRPEVVDGTLRRIDEVLFGVEPTLALQAIVTPWLSEVMTFAYALYFVHPLILLTLLYQRRDLLGFRELFLALNLCFYLGFVGYILVPAVGPRYYIPNEFQVELNGPWLTTTLSAVWSSLQSAKRDCFPSLHTAISTLSLIYLVRYRKSFRGGRLLLGVLAPTIVLLWISTIYLRYHWAIDVLAGFALAVFCARTAPWFIRLYYRKKLGSDWKTPLDQLDQAAG